MSYDYRAWRKRKIDKGEWLSKEEYLEKKRLKIEDYKEHSIYLEGVEKNLERLVILDTETTGLSNRDKIIELSIIEIIKGEMTDKIYHSYYKTNIKINEGAMKVHGIKDSDLEDKPLFKDEVEKIIKFIGYSKIVAHNSGFDMRMLNNELNFCDIKSYPEENFIDTLKIAKYLFPEGKCNLDSLCERFKVESGRLEGGKHSAVEDTKILCKVYQKLNKLLEDKDLTPYDFCKKSKIN